MILIKSLSTKITYIYIILIFSFIPNILFAQKISKNILHEYEDTLKTLSEQMINGETDEIRINASKGFKKELNEVLKYKESYQYDFKSINGISKLTGKNFKLFNWFVRFENGEYEYFGIIQIPKKKYNQTIILTDKSKDIISPENQILYHNNWFGALYYEIIWIKGTNHFTLLGWDGNDTISTKKIIDAISFDGGKIKFGLPIFIHKKTLKKRIVLEYNEKASISVQYKKSEKRIIFDHLVPINKMLEGLPEYYVPSGTHDAFSYMDGKWIYSSNIDARMKEKR